MKNITIYTAQNVPVEYELAVARDRILAALLDALVFFVIYYIAIFLIASTAGNVFFERFGAVFFFQFFPLFLFLGYHVFCDVLTGGTLGKKALKIKVIRLDGNEITLGDHGIRAAFYIIDCFVTLGFMAIVLVMSTEKAQRFGDMAANTTVIKLRPTTVFNLNDILSISTLSSYQPIYPQVVNLKEDDMILVKTILNRYRNYNNAAHQEAIASSVQRLQEILEIKDLQGDYFAFLNIILKDYIVLTR
jgi:uncharacterized RDD family membrane protein YckC